MLNCRQCMAFTWKTFRGRFLRQFLWIGVTREDKGKTKDPGPPSAGVSTSILAKAIADIEGEEQYQGLMSDTAQCYKRVNSQASAPLDISSSLSALEESASSLTEGEGGEANSSSAIDESSSWRQSTQTTADVHNADNWGIPSRQDPLWVCRLFFFFFFRRHVLCPFVVKKTTDWADILQKHAYG